MKNCAKTGNKSVGESARAGRWLGGSIGLAIMVGVIFWIVTEAYPEMAAELAAIDSVTVSHGIPVRAEAEERVKIPLLGPDEWSKESFDLSRVPVGVPYWTDGPADAQILFSDGENGPLHPAKPNGYGAKMGVARFKGRAGDHVTICWPRACQPEVRAEVPREPQEIPINEYGSGYPEQDKPPGWHLTPRSIQKERERREGVNTSP